MLLSFSNHKWPFRCPNKASSCVLVDNTQFRLQSSEAYTVLSPFLPPFLPLCPSFPPLSCHLPPATLLSFLPVRSCTVKHFSSSFTYKWHNDKWIHCWTTCVFFFLIKCSLTIVTISLNTHCVWYILLFFLHCV